MAKKFGSANEKRKYRHDENTRRVWRENYYRYVKPRREKLKKLKAGEKA
jgi:hypothetical protein